MQISKAVKFLNLKDSLILNFNSSGFEKYSIEINSKSDFISDQQIISMLSQIKNKN